MKETPDKIYLQEEMFGGIARSEYSEFPKHEANLSDVEYIRKNFLIEELTEMAANTGSDFQRAVLEILTQRIKAL